MAEFQVQWQAGDQAGVGLPIGGVQGIHTSGPVAELQPAVLAVDVLPNGDVRLGVVIGGTPSKGTLTVPKDMAPELAQAVIADPPDPVKEAEEAEKEAAKVAKATEKAEHDAAKAAEKAEHDKAHHRA